ncbi:autorepressor SdpR family transcription factor [Enterocloster clostridioformis]|nr:autorepressor SdpR family transcription factor [Enterocloster clostridioformis]
MTLGVNETFNALNDPIRREILIILKNNRLSAGDLATKFDISKSTLSYHLALLKKADLIYDTKYKNFIYYEINTSVLEDFFLWWFNQFKGDDYYEK